MVSEPIAARAARAIDPSAAWRWVHVGVAAMAMVATLPGRTHGLGLFTEPIRASLGLSKESYGFTNTCATLLGALFCLPCGWLMDRLGTRVVLTVVAVVLGSVVIAMSQVSGGSSWTLNVPLPGDGVFSVVILVNLFILILLTRGLGQSALSVASLSLVGRSVGRNPGLAMGIYACLTSVGFFGAFAVLRAFILAYPNEWRTPWAGIGLGVIVAGVLFALLVRDGVLATGAARESDVSGSDETSLTLGRALCHPCFWTFGLAISFYGMVLAGTSLFNETILGDLPFGIDDIEARKEFVKRVFANVTLLGIPVGLASNLVGGWLATRWSLNRLLALAMGILGVALSMFPLLRTEALVYVYAILLAAAGGVIAVCFYTVWRRGFGPAHLGKIQGAAQMLTVIFSAVGPLLFGSVSDRLGSYLPLFPYLAGASFSLAIAAWLAGLPKKASHIASNGD
jgi:MFS family permease